VLRRRLIIFLLIYFFICSDFGVEVIGFLFDSKDEKRFLFLTECKGLMSHSFNILFV